MRQRQPRPVRLIGVSVASHTRFTAPRQLSLFDLREGESQAKQVDQVVDTLADQIGSNAIYRATSHNWVQKKTE